MAQMGEVKQNSKKKHDAAKTRHHVKSKARPLTGRLENKLFEYIAVIRNLVGNSKMINAIKFPGGSKSRVNRAGDNVRNNSASADDLKVIEEWRAAHRGVLNTFQALLRTRQAILRTGSKGTKVTVAQRHKRKIQSSTNFGDYLVCNLHVWMMLPDAG